MFNHLNQWINTLPYQDEIQRSQATILQSFLLFFIGGSVSGLIFQTILAININGLAALDSLISIGTAYTLSLTVEVFCLILLRNGRLIFAAGVMAYGLIFMYSLILLAIGLSRSGLVATNYMIPITIAGLIMKRRHLFGASFLSIGVIILFAALEQNAPQFIGLIPLKLATVDAYVIPFTIAIGIFALILYRFSRSLFVALYDTRQREEELEQLRASLEQSVTERTAILQQTVQRLSESQATIQELGAPILPVLPGVLVLPLIGRLDQARMAFLTQQILYAVSQQRTSYVILDLTSTALIDEQTMDALIRTTNALHLLGSEVLLVGIRAEAAHTLVALGIDLSKLAVRKNLQEAVTSLMTAI